MNPATIVVLIHHMATIVISILHTVYGNFLVKATQNPSPPKPKCIKNLIITVGRGIVLASPLGPMMHITYAS